MRFPSSKRLSLLLAVALASTVLACQTAPTGVFLSLVTDLRTPDELSGLTLRLSGSVSTNHLTPQLVSMSPTAALNQDVALSLTGLNFAVGATVSWTVGAGPTQSFAANVINGGFLTTTIPAASVGPSGTATVRVNNPAPCQGSCTSNSLTFLLENQVFVYVPLVRR